jgi:hypothetical protein
MLQLQPTNMNSMSNPENDNQNTQGKDDKVTMQDADENSPSKSENEGFKTGKQSNGLTWQTPLEEQAFDDQSLSEKPADEEGD